MKICYCFILFVIIISCSKGTSSGNGGTNPSTPPTLTTSPVTNITHLSAISGGSIIDPGGAAITMRGVCWSLNPNPTISDSRTYDGPGAGNFTSSIFVPMRGTQYFVRAYATNSAGTGYGNELSFTTAGYREGQIVAGDIVFVVSSDGNSALLAAPTDVKIGDSVSFSYWPVTGSPPWTFPWIGATNDMHGWGDQNTDKIVSHPQCPSDAAAKLARNYVSPVDGHGGYYLPNSSELFTLMIERTRGTLGNAPFYQDSLSRRYWASDEVNSFTPEEAKMGAYNLAPNSISVPFSSQKTTKAGIRPIRKIGNW